MEATKQQAEPSASAMRAAERILDEWTCHALAGYPDIVNATGEQLAAVIEEEMGLGKALMDALGHEAERILAERNEARDQRDTLLTACGALCDAISEHLKRSPRLPFPVGILAAKAMADGAVAKCKRRDGR